MAKTGAVGADPRSTLISGLFAVVSMCVGIVSILGAVVLYSSSPLKPAFIRGFPFPFPVLNSGYVIFGQYISELGIGPSSFLFNYGLMVTGVLAVPLFPGLLKLLRNTTVAKVGVIFGSVAAIALIGVGAFPMVVSSLHGPFSTVFFVCIGVSIVLISWEMLRGAFFSKAIAYYGFFFVLVDLSFIILGNPAAEWGFFFVIVTWLLATGIQMLLKRSVTEI